LYFGLGFLSEEFAYFQWNQSTKLKASFQKIRPVALRLIQRSFTAPARDLGMIAVQ
jgi:hypothetical protein